MLHPLLVYHVDIFKPNTRSLEQSAELRLWTSLACIRLLCCLGYSLCMQGVLDRPLYAWSDSYGNDLADHDSIEHAVTQKHENNVLEEDG